jgi:hypothetical protein
VKSVITIVTEREAVTDAGMTKATGAHHPAVPSGRAHRRSDADGHDRGGQDCYFAHHDACSVGCVKPPRMTVAHGEQDNQITNESVYDSNVSFPASIL